MEKTLGYMFEFKKMHIGGDLVVSFPESITIGDVKLLMSQTMCPVSISFTDIFQLSDDGRAVTFRIKRDGLMLKADESDLAYSMKDFVKHMAAVFAGMMDMPAVSGRGSVPCKRWEEQ